MQRIMTSAALVLASALLLSGCAAGGGGEATADVCDTVQDALRDISNGAQNALAAGGDPSELKATLEGYSERIDELAESSEGDGALAEALDAIDVKLDEAAEFVETLPSDPEAEVDADAVAERQTAIQKAAAEVAAVCTNDTEETEG